MQVLMVDTSREILRLGCRARQSLRISQAVVFFDYRRGIEKEKWLAAHLARERASYERCFEYTNWEKKVPINNLKCPLFYH